MKHENKKVFLVQYMKHENKHIFMKIKKYKTDPQGHSVHFHFETS